MAGTTNLLHFNIQPPLLALRASSEKSVSHGSHGNCTNTDGRPSFRFRRDSCEDLVSRPGSADERTLSLLFRPRIDRPRSHSLPLTPVPMLRCCFLSTSELVINVYREIELQAGLMKPGCAVSINPVHEG